MLRPINWCDFLLDVNMTGGQVELDDLLVNAPAVDTITVTRIIGDFVVMPGPTQESEAILTFDVGIGVINKEAFDLGTGVGIPNPTVEDSYPPRGWLYAARKPVFLSIPGGATPGGHGMIAPEFKFDLRGQRKVDKGVLFMWMEQNLTEGSNITVTVVGCVRVLYKA